MYGEGDKYLGKAIQYPTCFLPHLEIWDDKEQKLFDVNGPCCVCCSDTEYPVRKYLKSFMKYLIFHDIIISTPNCEYHDPLIPFCLWFRFQIQEALM